MQVGFVNSIAVAKSGKFVVAGVGQVWFGMVKTVCCSVTVSFPLFKVSWCLFMLGAGASAREVGACIGSEERSCRSFSEASRTLVHDEGSITMVNALRPSKF